MGLKKEPARRGDFAYWLARDRDVAEDVVQEALLEALRRLPAYVDERPIAFYPWLRQIAWNRLIDLHRRHILAGNRAVDREVSIDLPPSGQSLHQLAQRFLSREPSPTARDRKSTRLNSSHRT